MLKVSVGVIWAFYTTYLVCFACGFHQLMTAIGPAVGVIPTTINIGSFFASFTQCMVQAIYVYRIYRLSKKHFISISCWIVIFYNLCAGMAYNKIFFNQNPAVFVRLEKQFEWLFISWYSATGAVDIVITGTLCYKLLRMRRNEGMNNTPRSSDILETVVLWTVQTGMITSILAVAIVVLYYTVANPGPWISLTSIITSVYALSLVTLLNGRSILLKNQSDRSEATTADTLTTPIISGINHSMQSDTFELKQFDNDNHGSPC